VTETVASLLFPWMLILALPIIGFAWTGNLHAWFKINPADDHALDVKKVLFNPMAFTVLVPALITVLGLLARQIRAWSIAQDKDGAAHWTSKSRKLSAAGIFLFAFGVTLLCFLLMKSFRPTWYSSVPLTCALSSGSPSRAFWRAILQSSGRRSGSPQPVAIRVVTGAPKMAPGAGRICDF
jgi:hypothetical protein